MYDLQHQPPTPPREILERARPTAAFPCALRLHREDTCKDWLLEIHTAWNLGYDHPLEDDDAAVEAGFEAVRRFVEVGLDTLGTPDADKVSDLRVRLMGNSGEWAMFELTRLPADELDAAIDRFTAAYGHAPMR